LSLEWNLIFTKSIHFFHQLIIIIVVCNSTKPKGRCKVKWLITLRVQTSFIFHIWHVLIGLRTNQTKNFSILILFFKNKCISYWRPLFYAFLGIKTSLGNPNLR
jgi:hypothetical protein